MRVRDPSSGGFLLVAAFAALAGGASAAAAGKVGAKTESTTTTSPTAAPTPCTAKSVSGSFYDLRPDIAVLPAEGAKPHQGTPAEDYVAKGYDYNANFTLNICSAVVKPPSDVVGVDSSAWKNVSAYYETKEGRTYSLGQQSSALITRGSKLVLQYTGGSPCTASGTEKRDKVREGSYKSYEDDEESIVEAKTKSKGTTSTKLTTKAAERRKSTTISFICDREAINTEAVPSFISADPDECAYFFQVRSHHACPKAEPQKPGNLGPGSVFAIILLIAVLVYLVGGVFYQRTVAHARGWRHLPNYSLWSGIWNFLKDILVILTSSCARYLPSRRGYRSLAHSPSGRGRNREDENRLIDQLDEEWDD